MARISKEARKHAARRALGRAEPLDGILDDDEELGSTLGGIGRLVGGVAGTVVGGPAGTAIGSSLGGAVGDLVGGKPKPTSDAAPPAQPAMMMSPAPEGSSAPTREEIRGIVEDALAAGQARMLRDHMERDRARQTARETADRVRAALEPTARRTRGSIQEQRLQTQATQEHAAIMRREAREREARERHTVTQALLSRILDSVGKVQQKLSGRVAVVRDRAIDILGGDAVVKTR